MASAMSSLAEAAAMLARHGRPVDVKTLRSITYRFSQRARATQRVAELGSALPLQGRRCAVSVDGGRMRIRTPKRGRHTAKKRQRYHTDWREPKLLHIWLLDSDGTILREASPWIDGALHGPDELFGLLRHYLTAFEVTRAEHVLFIADGARWIWNRVERLISELNLNTNKVTHLVDFYHAAQHLGVVVSLKKGWSSKKRARWLNTHKKALKNGKVDSVVAAVHKICRGRISAAITRERDYFAHNAHRMNYARARSLHLPIGSGPMESAIRRVINLRLKGAGVFWREENAEAMIMLRSFYKAGRWDLLLTLATSHPITEHKESTH